MLIYIIKSAACMAIFFGFYKLLLERENMHVFKRFYLLLALGASLTIPALVFTEYVVVEPIAYTEVQSLPATDYDYIGVPAALENDVLDVEPILWTIYFCGFVFFGLRFTRNLFQIIRRVQQNDKQKSTHFIQVFLKENFPPHTFFKYIFLNKKKFEAKEIPQEVLLHEETHARQKHSLDVVFIELLQVIFWFNPLVYVFKKAIKLNHEFLADQAVLNKNIDKTTYQNTLLSYLSPDSQNKYQSKLANAINYSSIKKRFTIMKTHTSKKAVLLRSLLLLPLLAMLLLAFSETKLIEVSPPINNSEIPEKASVQELLNYTKLATKYNAIAIEQRKIPLDDLKVLEAIFKKMSAVQKETAPPFPECLPTNIQDGASRKLMAEYNTLAKKYNNMLSESKQIRIQMKDVERMEYIYGLMSDKQKADAEPFPEFPDPPPAPKEPKAPKPKKGDKRTIPPSPPSPQEMELEEVTEFEEAVALEEVAEVAEIEEIVGFEEPIELKNPVAPPPPTSPLDHIIDMAKLGATFYYEGQQISSDKAIELLKNNQDLNIQSSGKRSKKPKVKISKEPIYLNRSAVPTSIETGNIEMNGTEGFYSKKDGVTSYFNANGQQVNKNGKLLKKNAESSPKFYFNDRQISAVEANRLLTNNTSIQVSSKAFNDGSYIIQLTDLNASNYQNTNRNKNPNAAIDLTEMIAKEALFYHNDSPITTEKALWLTKNSLIERVNTIRPKQGKPSVYFWSKV